MSERFIKFIPSEEAMFLVTHKNAAYVNAFRLLTIIAKNARRYNGHPDGLQIGETFLGGHQNYGMTDRNYRTAKQILVKRLHIEIIETNRKRKKSTNEVTNGMTTVGTRVKLLSSNVYDINIEEYADRNDDRRDELTTNRRRIDDDIQERIRKKKKEIRNKQPHTPSFFSAPSKIKFREFVHLTQIEYDSLLEKNGPVFLNLMLDVLDAYKGSSGKKYDSDFHTMKQGGWVANRVLKDLQEQKLSNEKSLKPTSGTKISSNIQPSDTKFQPSRILRGSNDNSERSLDTRCINE